MSKSLSGATCAHSRLHTIEITNDYGTSSSAWKCDHCGEHFGIITKAAFTAQQERIDELGEMLTYTYASSANQPFLQAELLASAFYAKTGIVAPFKSAPMHCDKSQEERQAEYKKWIDGMSEKITTFFHNAIEEIIEPEEQGNG